jgi:hypothetical protein
VNGRWVVELGEHADNRGLPVTQVFPALSARVRSFLPQGPEPVWIEHWPQRALLAQVLGEPGVFGRHLRARIATGIWIRTPLPWSAFVTLVTGRMSHALGSTAQGGGASQPA